VGGGGGGGGGGVGGGGCGCGGGGGGGAPPPPSPAPALQAQVRHVIFLGVAAALWYVYWALDAPGAGPGSSPDLDSRFWIFFRVSLELALPASDPCPACGPACLPRVAGLRVDGSRKWVEGGLCSRRAVRPERPSAPLPRGLSGLSGGSPSSCLLRAAAWLHRRRSCSASRSSASPTCSPGSSPR
jgi:hypothetical protein